MERTNEVKLRCGTVQKVVEVVSYKPHMYIVITNIFTKRKRGGKYLLNPKEYRKR